jgi:hypothetical protein
VGHYVRPKRKRKTSFLKKRSKKLLLVAAGILFKAVNKLLPATEKSFLVLFFKKEHLPSCCFHRR